MVLGSGAMCLGRIVMMLGGFKMCIFWHIHSPCQEFPFWTPGPGSVYTQPPSSQKGEMH
jgi:hypothetical protein